LKSRPRNRALWSGLIAASACLVLLVWGCPYRQWSSDGSGGGGEPGTKYFVLTGPPLRFQATDLGVAVELADYGGGPHCVPLDQYEMRPGDLKGWAGDFATLKHADGRCTEIGLWCGGVICRRYRFEYDAAGRLQSRIDTEYELRRGGESSKDWAKRLRGQTPAMACAREFEYAWSEDGRTVEVSLQALQGKPKGFEPISLPRTPWGKPGERLETWRLNSRGLIISVRRGGVETYSAQYDDVGRLLCYERNRSEKAENRYDGQGRLLETHVRYAVGTRGIVVHAYPGGPRPDLPHLKEPGDEAWVVTHDKYGRVSRIREHAGPSSDIMANTFEEFKRDEAGRIIWRRVGFAR